MSLAIPLAPGAAIIRERFSSGDTFYFQSGTLDGQPYQFFRGGSGSFGRMETYGVALHTANWDVLCQQDDMTDERWCMISKGDLFIHLYEDGDNSLSIGADTYPGSGISIRIDNGKQIFGDEDGWSAERANRLIGQLQNATVVTTRYSQWPSGVPTTTINTEGLPQALYYARWVLNGQNAEPPSSK